MSGFGSFYEYFLLNMIITLSSISNFRHVTMVSLIFLLVSLKGISTLHAQQLPYLNTFSATETNGQVYLNWIIASGNTCDGVRVYRSADGIEYNQIGDIGGICGSPYSAVSYEFWDTMPLLNTLSYYKLELGNLGFSHTEELTVYDFSKQGYQLIPHPFRGGGVIAFNNPASETWKLLIFTLDGRLAWEAEHNGRTFSIPAGKLKTGTYVFQLVSQHQNKKLSGKLLVLD